ncbi:PREDICTED: uncharacterized protein LOC105570409 [Vollenhovia emeryi]|uniref:uncharacterized protein LOC105570409 n=1 Tax=Vollenhovia emeryi TaxID=411798 RepID=UPI0005F3E8CA|nr:PREDICTED: uncharacterized protein LOC105570409 [Vollenhovia emeryi]
MYNTDSPSYPRGGSYIDLVLADTRLDLQTNRAGSLNTLAIDSDHRAISFQVSFLSDELEFNSEIKQNLNYNKADWDKFQELLSLDKLVIPNNRNLSIKEIDEYIMELETSIKSAMNASIPQVKNTNSVDKYMNSKIKKLQKQKNFIVSLIHRWERKFRPINTEIKLLKSLLKDLKIELRHEITASMNFYWEKRVGNITHSDPKKLFPEINRMFRHKNQLEIPCLRIPEKEKQLLELANINIKKLSRDSNNSYLIQDAEQKLDILGSHFATINNQNDNLGKPRLNEIILKETGLLRDEMESDNINNHTFCSFNDDNIAEGPSVQTPCSLSHYFTNSTIVSKKFKYLNNKKSSGLDNIPNIALKHIPPKIIYLYTILFNNMINHSYFPQRWKEAKVLAIPKKDKDKELLGSYRPISLLPNIGKIYEMIINDIITSFCTKNNLLPENQFGFRARHSTIHAINKLVSDVNWALNNDDCLGACMVDLEKAFDTVWHEGLIFRLIKRKVPVVLIKLIAGYNKLTFVVQLIYS